MAFKFGTQRSLGAGIGDVVGGLLKPQDVFATSLYTGNGGVQSITNGIDLAGKGGLAWFKQRNAAGYHVLVDSLRGSTKYLASQVTDAEADLASPVGFNANGFTLNGNSAFNGSGGSEVNWSFAFAPKFCVAVTWTGDGTASRQIPHGLGVVPGMVIVKIRNASGIDWQVFHKSLSGQNALVLNSTAAQAVNGNLISSSSTSITLDMYRGVNGAGDTYVAYLFAHDPSADGIVQCGSSVSASGGLVTIPHGWVSGAQWVVMKRIDAAEDWFIYDAARSPGLGPSQTVLRPNTSGAEQNIGSYAQTTGSFSTNVSGAQSTYIWAIIRAPY